MKNVDRRAQREAVLLGDRAAERVESMHEGAPWEGVLVEAGSVRALVEGTGL